MAPPKKIYGVNLPFSALIFTVYGVCGISTQSRKPVAPQSELRDVGTLELKLELVRNERDELGIGGFSLGIGHGVAEEALEGIQIAPVPGYFDGVPNGSFNPGRSGLERLRHLWVQYLRDGVRGLTARLGGLWKCAV